MGMAFQLEHANLVAYLTVQQAPCPQVRYGELSGFLSGIRYGWQDGSLLSRDKSWAEAMGRKAEIMWDRIPDADRWSDRTLPKSELESLIRPLREDLSRYAFYALAVFDPAEENSNRELGVIMSRAAYASGTAGLFLIPGREGRFDYGILDPFPPLQTIARNPHATPGVVFWNNDTSAFVHFTQAERVLKDLMAAGQVSPSAITKVLRECSSGSPDKRLLHLSDLHFGTPRANALQEYLIASIAREAKTVDRIVITGDLFDTPDANSMNAFQSFRSQLERLANKDVIIIPGNHDQSFKGNRLGGLGKDLAQIASLEWSSLVVDDEMNCVFFGFDSSLDAKLAARGRITPEQLIRVGTQYQTRLDRNPDLASYLSIALVHHHPFSWKTNEPNILGFSLESLLLMDQSDVFLQWCVRKGIKLILHGHKHQPRHVFEHITAEDSADWITSIGCGSSLGAENGPLSYNIVYWSAANRKWSASFMVDPGDASGFKPRYVSLSNANSQ